jgi:hypothetical protein
MITVDVYVDGAKELVQKALGEEQAVKLILEPGILAQHLPTELLQAIKGRLGDKAASSILGRYTGWHRERQHARDQYERGKLELQDVYHADIERASQQLADWVTQFDTNA